MAQIGSGLSYARPVSAIPLGWGPAPYAVLRNVPRRRICRATADGASGELSAHFSSAKQTDLPDVIFTPSGHVVSLQSRKRRFEAWPELHYSREEAVEVQLQALKANDEPSVDHGIEVLYRFASFDPFNPRTLYFGRMFDLGQFERFRRIMRTSPYATLLNHDSATIVSALEVNDRVWIARVAVVGAARGSLPADEALYEFTMAQRLGGVHDGYWYTQSLVADGNAWEFLKGPKPGAI